MKLTERRLRSIIRMILKEAYESDENDKNDDIFDFIIKVLEEDIDLGLDLIYSFDAREDDEIKYTKSSRGGGREWHPGYLRVDKETISKLRDCFDKNNESMAKQVVLNLAKNKLTKDAKLQKTF